MKGPSTGQISMFSFGVVGRSTDCELLDNISRAG